MTVRAKLQVLEIKHHHVHAPRKDPTVPESVHVEIRAVPVNSASGKENESWSKWTPSGELKLTITNPPAADFFEIGREYYVDFTPAE